MKWVRFAATGAFLAVAGLLVSCSAAPAPLQVKLTVGQRAGVHMIGAGAAGLPHTSFPSVLAPAAAGASRATQTYRAARPGHAVLTPDVKACLALRHREVKGIPGSCPVIAVTVVP